MGSIWGTSENNRRAKFYLLTSAGRKQLMTELETWDRLSGAIALVLGQFAGVPRRKEFFTRARFFFFPRRAAEVDEELRFHLEQATEAQIAAGMSPEDAHRQARVLFGGLEAARETCHQQKPGWWLGTFMQDARYALRGFRRKPIFALTVIATLALGIGATTAIFSVVDRILFRSLPYAQDDRLVSVGLVQSLAPQEFMLGGFYYEWRDNQKPFASLTFERGVDECNLMVGKPCSSAVCGRRAELSAHTRHLACFGSQFRSRGRSAQGGQGCAYSMACG